MRKAPHPLLVHLGMAMNPSGRIHEYASEVSKGNTLSQMTEIIRGIQLYQSHDFIPPILPRKTMWQNNNISVSLPLCANGKEGEHNAPPILLVPSLINKSNILDLTKDMSLLRWLGNNGRSAYLLDWGDLYDENDAAKTIGGILAGLREAIQFVSNKHDAQIDILGYCMGGNLALGACADAPDNVRRMVLLASPWDFHEPTMMLSKHVRIWNSYIAQAAMDRGRIPSEWVQALFAGYDVDGAAHKFIRFASMNPNSIEAQTFIAVEDWLNDGVDLPLNIAQHCIQEWFFDNALLNNKWHVDGVHLDMKKITFPTLIVASEKDRLVPYNSASSAKKTLENAQTDICKMSCGHIGLIAGRGAADKTWFPILEWLQKK